MKILTNRQFKVTTMMSAEDVRILCIQKQYYTNGDTEAYNALLDFVRVRDNFTDEDLLTIANDIYTHSNINRFKDEYGCSDEDVFSAIFFEVARTAHKHVEVE